MNALAPPFPTNPSPGDTYCGWVWNGTSWVCQGAGPTLILQVLTGDGTYFPSPGLTFAVVECIGGGGCGGQVWSGSATLIVSGAGGGSGGYSKKIMPAALVRGGIPVVIGAGGLSANASDGGQTSFGQFCIANGGGAGAGNNGSTVFGDGGAEAETGVGDLTLPGAAGEVGAWQTGPVSVAAAGGLGGQIMGGNSISNVGVNSYAPGASAHPYTGAGGSGGCINQSTTQIDIMVEGGDGGAGVCIVSEYCLTYTGGGGCDGQQQGMARVAAPAGWRGYGGYDE